MSILGILFFETHDQALGELIPDSIKDCFFVRNPCWQLHITSHEAVCRG